MVCAHCGSPIEPGGVAWLRGSAYCAACIRKARTYQRVFFGCWLVLAVLIVGFFLLAMFGGLLSALFGSA